jgi:hypothetical protein
MSLKPDFVFDSKDPQTKLDYIHRKAANADIYLVVNRFARKGINDTEYRYLTDLPDRYESVECSFRVPAGSKPSLWNPVTGEISAVSNYKEENGRTIVALELIPEGSVFVVFSKTIPSIAAKKTVSPLILSSSKPLSPKWTLRFTPQMGTPETIETEELKSLTDFSEENIRYYSGKVTYSATFTLTGRERSSRNIVLDLGNLHEMAMVRLNGKQIDGLLWQPPYILNITDAIRKGANSLEIDVYNLWPNRLIGDGKLPPDKRFTRTNIEKFDASGADTLLRISGLLGPVNLKFYEK